jgi:predicted nucleotidyltransferase component of viral defense system
MERYDSLQLREIFHIEFLRRFGRVVKTQNYAVKGGVNLRFFFKSFRYSEDIDLDVRGISVFGLKESVMKVLGDASLQESLKTFGIAKVTAPDIAKAKQTETTQRFKVHLITASGEDLFTKIEFSRRGLTGSVVVEAIDEIILRRYKMAPLLAPHYDSSSALGQKISALALRKDTQARDIFDIYVLGSQYGCDKHKISIDKDIFSKAYERVFEVGFEQFKDTVASYLSSEDGALYSKPESWEEVRIKAAQFIEEARKGCA